MKQIEKALCKFCMGCMKLQNEQFNGVMRCENFAAGVEDWQEKLRKELKKFYN